MFSYTDTRGLETRWDIAASTVQLQIPAEWMFWSGWYPGGPQTRWNHERKKWELWEPMDDILPFDESTAFPVEKPNIDVLWPSTSHSRKQRGWYRVKPWPPRSPLSPLDSDSRPTLATAADIPEEIFERIIGGIDEDDKHTLAKCGQVCRYWASQCRPRLFSVLRLHSRQDALRFRDFTKDPACRFFPHLWSVALAPNGLSELNWIHLAIATVDVPADFNWMNLWSQVWDGNPFELGLVGPLPASMKTLRSIHHAVPRSLPRSFSRRISDLHLAHIHFRRFDDLTHLAGELPDLARLRCAEVTWAPLPTTFPRRRPTHDRNKLQEWTMHHDGRPLCMRAVFFMFLSVKSRASFVSEDDLRLGLVAILETLDLGNTVRLEYKHYPGATILDLRLYRDDDLTASLIAELRAIPGGSLSFRLTAISITDNIAGEWPPGFWAEFDSFAAKVPFLRRVVFAFWCWRSLLHFKEQVVDAQLPLSTARNLVRYGISDECDTGMINTWRPVSRKELERHRGSRRSDLVVAHA